MVSPPAIGGGGVVGVEAQLVIVRNPGQDPAEILWSALNIGVDRPAGELTGGMVAWTGDAAREWSPGWDEWDQLSRFWVQMVRYSLPDPTHGPLLVRGPVTLIDPEGHEIEVKVISMERDG